MAGRYPASHQHMTGNPTADYYLTVDREQYRRRDNISKNYAYTSVIVHIPQGETTEDQYMTLYEGRIIDGPARTEATICCSVSRFEASEAR